MSELGEPLAARVGDDETGARRRRLAVDEHAGDAAAADVDARRTVGETAGAAVRFDALEKKFGKLVLAARHSVNATGPRAVESGHREGGQVRLREVRREADEV